jgi:hypothetical protein
MDVGILPIEGLIVVGPGRHGAWTVLQPLLKCGGSSIGYRKISGFFPTNAAAWSWIDRHTDEGRGDTDRYNRIRVAFSER